MKAPYLVVAGATVFSGPITGEYERYEGDNPECDVDHCERAETSVSLEAP